MLVLVEVLALIVASEYSYYLHRSSISLMSLDSWPKNCDKKLDTETDPFIAISKDITDPI